MITIVPYKKVVDIFNPFYTLALQIRIWKERPSEIQRLKREAFENRITNLGGRKKIMDAILAGKKLIAEV